MNACVSVYVCISTSVENGIVYLPFIIAALNYGVFRQQSFNTTPQYIMLYDMGAGSTIASIIGQFSMIVMIVKLSIHIAPKS